VTRILFVVDQLCAAGGAERVLLRTIDRLPRDRFYPQVVTFAMEPAFAIENSISCPVHVWRLRRTYDWSGLSVARRIRNFVRLHNIDITHTFHETSDTWAGPIAKLSGCPILISSRRDMGFQRTAKHRIAYRFLNRYFDQVHAVSEEVRRFAIEYDCLDPSRVITLYNGIDFPPPPAPPDKPLLRRRFGLPESGPLIISVGHIRKIKGFDVFLRAAAVVARHAPDAIFAIAGAAHESSYARELEAAAADLGLNGRFFFLGPVQQVILLLHCSDVFCLLSRSEGMSNALLEAMGAGLPSVATRVGGNPEVIAHEQTGYIVGSEDHQAAADAILNLLRNPPLARTMGAAARNLIAEKFTTEVMMRNLIECYDRLLAKRRNL
jgi:glycosyltransferase involved in cell wall biosynthesis